jgi:hypothetical protein
MHYDNISFGTFRSISLSEQLAIDLSTLCSFKLIYKGQLFRGSRRLEQSRELHLQNEGYPINLLQTAQDNNKSAVLSEVYWRQHEHGFISI